MYLTKTKSNTALTNDRSLRLYYFFLALKKRKGKEETALKHTTAGTTVPGGRISA